jgi:phosphate-selective porin
MRIARIAFLVAVVSVSGGLLASTTVDDLRKEVEALRDRLASERTKETAAPIGKADAAVAAKYGPNAEVTTRTGKLEIGGLLQIWNYRLGDDHKDAFGTRANSIGFGGTGEHSNSSYRIRRTQIKLRLDIHENVSAYVMIDPAREATSFAPMPTNQGLFKSKAFMAPEYDEANGPGLGSTAEVRAVQTGAGAAPRLLQDAYINFHGVVPHHDFTVGQFKPKMGEEGVRSAAYLDFAERAMVTQINDQRDLGVQIRGSWLQTKEGDADTGRVQYWLGLFDAASDFHGSMGQFQNRSDNNDAKDFLAAVQVRPIWKKGAWGDLELGWSGQWGEHAEGGGPDPINTPLNSLGQQHAWAIRQAAWAYYKPMGPVRGWWLRGEYGYQKDRAAPLAVQVFGLGNGPNGEQSAPNVFHRTGWYAATGYRLDESIFKERLEGGGFFNKLMKPVEFVFRYDTFQNIVAEDLVKSDTNTDVISTNVYTAGVNYYVDGYRVRVQLNYMLVDEQEDGTGSRNFREVKNNVLMFTYQVAF